MSSSLLLACNLTGITKSFIEANGNPVTILRHIDLMVNAGESVAILGASGSGKSTLLNILGLLDVPDGGVMSIAGIDTSSLNTRERARFRNRHVGFIFQDFSLLDHRSALHNVAEPCLYGTRQDIRERFGRAQTMLERVNLTHRFHAMPDTLSGGEQQRVAIARALVRQPDLILADEPTGALDHDTSTSVLSLLFEQSRQHNSSLIIVTHDREVASHADRMLTLVNGELVTAV